MAKLGPFSGTPQRDPVDGPQQLIEAGWTTSFDIRDRARLAERRLPRAS